MGELVRLEKMKTIGRLKRIAREHNNLTDTCRTNVDMMSSYLLTVTSTPVCCVHLSATEYTSCVCVYTSMVYNHYP